MSKRVAVALLVFAATACGKRGDPHPPVPVIPKATSDLVVAQRGSNVILSWSYPSMTTTGQKLGAVRRVVVYRAVEELPVTQPPRDTATLLPGDIDPTIPTALSLFAKVPPLGRNQFTRLRQRLDSIEGARLPGATAGTRLLYEDTPPFHTTDGRPVRIDYAVVTEGTAARSDISNIAAIVPIDVPEPPAGVVASPKAQGVVLTWSAPKKVVTGSEKPRVVGYNVYRVAEGQLPDELAVPLNTSPIAQTTYTDTPSYGQHQYRVTAVASTGPPRIESDFSNAVTAAFRDLVAPPVPTGLTALVETKAVRLVWDPVEARDLAGYNVYRTEGAVLPDGTIKAVGRFLDFIAPATQTNFRDTGPAPGIHYLYEVTSFDKSGNESKPAKTDWIMVPKTP